MELEPASVEVAPLRVADGKIAARGAGAVAREGDEIVELHGKLVLPGLISTHHHLYSTLLRGAPRDGSGFAAEQAALWRLEESLDLEGVEAAAAAGGLEGLMAGTTAVIDLHASPAAIEGSLSRVARGLSAVGLRGAVSYAVTERLGPSGRDQGLQENVANLKRARGRVRGGFGAYDIDELSDEGLAALKAVWEPSGAFLHLHVGEDPLEEGRSKARYAKTPVARLRAAGLLGERTILAQGVHLSWPELSELLDLGAWLVHSPRSNMASQAGTAAAAKFGVRGSLGTDTQGLDVLAEAQAAWLRARDSGQPIDVLRYLANGHRLAAALLGLPIGALRVGGLADLVVCDYRPPTPLTAETLAQHVLNGLTSRHVESVMVDGIWRLWGRKPLAVKSDEVAAAARSAAMATWTRMAEGEGGAKKKAAPVEPAASAASNGAPGASLG